MLTYSHSLFKQINIIILGSNLARRPIEFRQLPLPVIQITETQPIINDHNYTY